MGVPGLSEAPERRTEAGGPASPPRLAVRLLDAALRAVARVETQRALALAGAAGRAYARLGGPRVADARTNLRIAFPEWSEARRQRVLESSFANLARSAAEFAQLPYLDADALRARVAVEGLPHLEEARRRSRSGGVVALTGHFGNWELLAAAMAARGFPLTVVHRRRGDPGLEALVTERRAAAGTALLGRGNAARGALRALREGGILAMPFDQNCGREEGVFVPFFGRLACVRDGPVRVAMRTGAAVLPVFLHRIGEGSRHVARVHPPLELAAAGADREAAVRENAARMTRAIEAAVREAPDQWAWLHRRWRTAPAGEPHPYGRRGG